LIANIYTYRGSKQSLVAPWVTAGYLLTDETLDCEHRIPHVKHMYNKRKSINKFDDLLTGYLDIRTSLAHEVNSDGEYCIRKAEDSVIRGFRAYGSLTINRITKPTLWYERLTVIAAVFYRTEYLRRNSRRGYDLLELEHNLDKHIKLLQSYEYLPPYYLWDKTMGVVQNIEPKPQWWHTELNTLRSDLNYDEPC